MTRSASLGLSFLKAFGRAYPLMSGCGAIANSRAAKLLAPTGPEEVWAKLSGAEILATLDDHVGRSLIIFGDLDPKVTAVLRRLVRPGDVVLDIGANLGLVSVLASGLVGAAGRVHAFEPNPVIASRLARTIERNRPAPITLHQIALGRRDETLRLHVPADNAGAASLTDASAARAVEVVDVPVRRLDGLMAEIGETKADFIKLDVEGFEAEALAGARDFLAAAAPRAIILEEHGFRPGAALPESFEILAGLGYRLHALPKRIFSVALQPIAENPQPANDYVALRSDVTF